MKDTTIAIVTVGLITITAIILSTCFKSDANTEIVGSAFLCIGSLTGGVALGRATKREKKEDEQST